MVHTHTQDTTVPLDDLGWNVRGGQSASLSHPDPSAVDLSAPAMLLLGELLLSVGKNTRNLLGFVPLASLSY